MVDPCSYVPSLGHLEKLGRGRSAGYFLGSAVSEPEGREVVQICLRVNLDAYKHCLQLVFTSSGKKAGYVLFHVENSGVFFRGMEVSPQFRGRGLSKVLFAAWLTICLRLGATPRTIVLNKPLLSHIVLSFGFIPRYKTIKFEVCADRSNGETIVWAHDKSTERTALSNKAVKSQRIRFVDVRPGDTKTKTVYMNTEYFPCAETQLRACIDMHMQQKVFKFASNAFEVNFCTTAFFRPAPESLEEQQKMACVASEAWDVCG